MITTLSNKQRQLTMSPQNIKRLHKCVKKSQGCRDNLGSVTQFLDPCFNKPSHGVYFLYRRYVAFYRNGKTTDHGKEHIAHFPPLKTRCWKYPHAKHFHNKTKKRHRQLSESDANVLKIDLDSPFWEVESKQPCIHDASSYVSPQKKK